VIKAVIKGDPYAADLWLGLARLALNRADKVEYDAALARLKELTPGLQYQIVRR
jgi:hypothetical protein